MNVAHLATVAILSSQILAMPEARAEDEMSNFKTKVEGVGWLFPTLTLHVVIHENSHAMAARLMGADAVTIRWLPAPGTKQRWGALATTGWMKRNGTTEGEKAFVGVAPQITNVTTMAAYALLLELGIPSNEHVRLPLTEMAAWA